MKSAYLTVLCAGALIALLFLSACVSLAGENTSNDIAIGSEEFLSLESDFYLLAYQVIVNEDNSYGDIELALEEYMRFYDRMADAGIFDTASAEYLYFDALIKKEITNILLGSDPEEAQRYYRAAVESARAVAAYNTEFANAYSLLASILNQSFNIIGAAEGLATLTTSQRLIDRALNLDARNPGAWETQGINYLYIPIGFGGDYNLAIDAFAKQAQHPYPYHKFWGRIWLSLAYFVEGRLEESLDTIAELRQETANSRFLNDFASAIESGQRPF